MQPSADFLGRTPEFLGGMALAPMPWQHRQVPHDHLSTPKYLHAHWPPAADLGGQLAPAPHDLGLLQAQWGQQPPGFTAEQSGGGPAAPSSVRSLPGAHPVFLENGSNQGLGASMRGAVASTANGLGVLPGAPGGYGGAVSSTAPASCSSVTGRTVACGVPPPAACEAATSSMVVPIDYANARLWGITSEYENLLNIQKDQHLTATRQRDAEVANLRRLVQDLQAGQGRLAEDGFIARLRAKDEECALALEATRKELALFAGLLQTRDRQIAELQAMCESKQAHSSISPSTAQSPVSEEVAKLRRDNAQLERLLLAKEKQMNALQAVDLNMADASALQLGAQAVQMFHDSMRMRAEADNYCEENKGLQAKLERLQAQTGHLEATVAEKRGEVKEMTTTLGVKVQRVLELEAEVDRLSREQDRAAQDTGSRLEHLQEELYELREGSRAKQHLAEHLKEEVADRDQRVLRQQVECSEHKSNAGSLGQRVAELEEELTNSERQLADLLRSSSHKDHLVREMTDQVNTAETKLHTYQINELMSGRRRRLDQSQHRDDSVDISSAALASQDWTRSPSEPVAQPSSPPSRFTPSGKDVEQQPVNRFNSASRRADGGQVLCNGSAHGVAVNRPSACGGHGFLDGSYGASNAVARDAAECQHANGYFHQPEGYSHMNSARGTASTATPPPYSYRSHHMSPSAPMPSTQSYRPQPGDHIDQLLADFVNQPQNSACQALFCRLGEGVYLYGTRRTCLREKLGTGCLEALHNKDWLRMEDFVRRMEASQGVHLQRAREVTGGAASLVVGRS